MRGGSAAGNDGGEVALARFRWASVVCVVVRNWMGHRNTRRRFRRTAGDIDNEGLVDGLPAREVCLEGPPHGLFGAEVSVLVLLPRADAEDKVGGVKRPAEGIGVLAQDHVPNVVNEVVLIDGDEGGGGAGSLDPDLAGDHVAWSYGQKGPGAGGVVVMRVGVAQQVLDEGSLAVGEKALAAKQQRVWVGRDDRGGRLEVGGFCSNNGDGGSRGGGADQGRWVINSIAEAARVSRLVVLLFVVVVVVVVGGRGLGGGGEG
jgi:hypothetical protein